MSETKIDAPSVADLVDFAPAKEPAKRWWNWYQKLGFPHRLNSGKRREVGDVFCGDAAWPSKDVAETAEAVCRAEHNATGLVDDLEYLGAFPEGERP